MSKRLPAVDALTLVADPPPPQAEKVFLIAADLIAYQRWHADGEAVGWDEPKGGLPVLGDLVVEVCRAGTRSSSRGRFARFGEQLGAWVSKRKSG